MSSAADGGRSVPTSPLGRSGLSTSVIGFGCWYPDAVMSTRDAQQEMVNALVLGSEYGVTLVDTAENYGPDHQSERLIGRALRSRRADFVVSTKFGVRLPASKEGRLFTAPTGASMRIATDPRLIPALLDRSLKFLGTDYVDIYSPHYPDPAVPIEEVVGAVGALVTAGKVRHVGLSNVDADLLRRANSAHPIAMVQNQYSLLDRTPESDTLPVCRELGIGFLAWSPLARGRASGIAESEPSTGLNAHELALAWLRQRAPDVVPVPGMQTRDQLEANIKMLDVVLDGDVMAKLDAVPWEPDPRGWLTEYRRAHGVDVSVDLA
jgi:aryl-alcohol dehydrogenase-like predicted oxidoreductase